MENSLQNLSKSRTGSANRKSSLKLSKSSNNSAIEKVVSKSSNGSANRKSFQNLSKSSNRSATRKSCQSQG